CSGKEYGKNPFSPLSCVPPPCPYDIETDCSLSLPSLGVYPNPTAKNTSNVIPLCHPLPLNKCSLDFELLSSPCAVKATAVVKVTGLTGVEMEALHAVSVALLTIYDMCKAIDKRMEISDIHLDNKTGGKSGEFIR
ncbi:MAG: hypothetical protein IIT82_03425, partial [Selenomonas sp.]|nr:hypothetical protein [Selenomonas sp.]